MIQLTLENFRLETGSVVWCKYKKHPYWPGIIWEKNNKSNRASFEVLFFGTFTLGSFVEIKTEGFFCMKVRFSFRFFFRGIDRKTLEPFEGVVEFKKRLSELKASEVKFRFSLKSRFAEEKLFFLSIRF